MNFHVRIDKHADALSLLAERNNSKDYGLRHVFDLVSQKLLKLVGGFLLTPYEHSCRICDNDSRTFCRMLS